MKGAFVLILLLAPGIYLSGCQREATTASGEKVIPREQMISLMTDMELTEATLKMRQSSLSTDSIKSLTVKSFDTLYAWHTTTPAQFKLSLAYYQEDLEDFEKMIDEVILNLTRERDSIQNLSVKKTDSVVLDKKL